MNIAVVGYGVEGRSAQAYWQAKGATVTICDQNADLKVPAGVKQQLGPNYLENLNRFDVVVRSAGIRPSSLLQHNPDIADKITTVINEFLRLCPTKNVIGVTGTKGKGTTSTLIARLLEASGKHVMLGGNIGFSPLEFLPHLIPESWVVLELSSFQLSDVKLSPHIAVCLMIVPEHLNWHTDMAEYQAAKSQLFAHQSANDIAIYYSANDAAQTAASSSPGKKVPYFSPPGAYVDDQNIVIGGQTLCQVSELKLLGKHNWQNVCAAVTAVWQIAPDVAKMHAVLTSFEGLPHRIERVRTVGDITYYNDSFATNPQAAVAAIEAIPGKKVLIVGGFDRMLDLTPLVAGLVAAGDSVRSALLIGASQERLATSLRDGGFTRFDRSDVRTMTEIVAAAHRLAKPGDAVVLSPAFPSFDMFKNFEERGLLYKEAVSRL